MAQLLIRNQVHVLKKRLLTVGTQPHFDIFIPSEKDVSPLLFSLAHRSDLNGRYEIHPSKIRIRINGQAIGRATPLSSCDRIEWSGGAAVYTEASLESAESETTHQESSSLRALESLQRMTATLHDGASISSALNQALGSLVEIAGAETGYLLAEIGTNSEWELMAAQEKRVSSDISPVMNQGESVTPSRAELLSHTILQEAIVKKVPVYIESIVGHPWASSESIIHSKIFSAACLPLCIEGRVFGGVFLLTRTPGISIRKESLSILNLLATQAGLLMASQLELTRAKKENLRLRSPSPETNPTALIYDRSQSVEMIELERKLNKLAATPLSVLILGETGTGKEMIARELHQQRSLRIGHATPFVAVNCAAIPTTLLESTLFGVEKGAFTGAVKSQPGKFLQAHGGTLFLDEIGDLPLELQAKLLRVLQDRRVEPVGSLESIPIDVQIVSATHQDLEKQVEDGRFRQDLYFRLCGSSLKLPPLRERRCDIPLFIRYFLGQLKLDTPVSQQAVEALLNYSFPGNIRELEHMITRAAFMTDSSEIQVTDLEMKNLPPTSVFSPMKWETILPLDKAQLYFTQEYVRRVLEKHEGNRANTAQFLGISERTLYRILSSSGLAAGVFNSL